MKRGLDAPRRPFRDARLYVIAVEGEKTELWYFNGLQQHVRGQRVRLEILPADGGASSPAAVAERLRNYAAKNQLKKFDQCWLVIDKDTWKGLDRVLDQVRRDRFHAAVSNPCFEVWLQLHFVEQPLSLKEIPDRERARAAKRGWGQLRQDKAGTAHWPFSRQHVVDAIARSSASDDGSWWPPCPGSHVHRLVEQLLQ